MLEPREPRDNPPPGESSSFVSPLLLPTPKSHHPPNTRKTTKLSLRSEKTFLHSHDNQSAVVCKGSRDLCFDLLFVVPGPDCPGGGVVVLTCKLAKSAHKSWPKRGRFK